MAKIDKKKKKLPFLYRLFAIILLIMSLMLIGSIIYLNILNVSLLLLVVIVILGISLLSILLLLKSKIKKIGLGLSVVLILLFGILIFYINKTSDFLNDLGLDYKTYNYSVVVKNDSDYLKLKDIKKGSIGYFADGSVEVDKALDKVLKKGDLEGLGYEDTHTMAYDLLKEDVDAILIENSYLDILDESMGFKSDIKYIYEFKIVTNTNDITRDVNVTDKAFNVYISGIDTFGSISSVSRSDVNMVVSINPATQQILLTSIPRDYYVQLSGKSGYRDKLTHAGLYGIDMSIRTLEDLLDMEINYYVKVNFSSVVDIVDAIGGIKIYSDYKFTSRDNYSYSKGYNLVNGEETLSFARERKAFDDGDRQRVRNQQAVFKAIFDKLTSKDIIVKYSKLLDSTRGCFVTNMPTARMTSLVKMQLNNNYSWNIVNNSLEGSDGSNYTYSAPGQKSYVMLPDEESVVNAKMLINSVVDGDLLESEEKNSINEVVHDVSKNETVFNETTAHAKAGLRAKLARSSITITEGDEYVYHGYRATYDGEEITLDDGLEEEFVVDNKSFDDYRDLVYYITYNLDSGSYVIKYNISYMNEKIVLEQGLIIKDLNDNNKIASVN